MSVLTRSILRGHMLAKLAGLVVILAILAVWYLFQDTSPVVELRTTRGTVTAIHEDILTVRLESGGSATVYAPAQLRPAVGAVVPLQIEVQQSGQLRAVFDQQAWMDGH